MNYGNKLEILTKSWPIDNYFEEDKAEPVIVEWKAVRTGTDLSCPPIHILISSLEI